MGVNNTQLPTLFNVTFAGSYRISSDDLIADVLSGDDLSRQMERFKQQMDRAEAEFIRKYFGRRLFGPFSVEYNGQNLGTTDQVTIGRKP